MVLGMSQTPLQKSRDRADMRQIYTNLRDERGEAMNRIMDRKRAAYERMMKED